MTLRAVVLVVGAAVAFGQPPRVQNAAHSGAGIGGIAPAIIHYALFDYLEVKIR